MAKLALHFLGEETAIDDAGSAVALPAISWSLIGMVLAAPHRRIGRTSLAAALWPDADDEAARHCLATALWRLKRRLGAIDTVLHISNEAIAFVADGDIWVDVLLFERHTLAALDDPLWLDDAANRETLREALTLYRGDFLAFSSSDAVAIERERLRALYLDASLELARACKRHGEWRVACELGRAICAVEPLREDAQRLLMEAMVACGNRAQAVQHYRDFERLLADELAVPPMSETRALAEEIARTSHIALPTPATPLRPDGSYRQVLLMARQQMAASLALLDEALAQ